MSVIVFDKRTTEKLDYTFSFVDALAAISGPPTIEGSPTITVSPSGLTLVSTTVNTPTSNLVTTVFSGGANGITYTVTCTVNITGSPDRDFTQTLYLTVVDSPAVDTVNLYATVPSIIAKLGITSSDEQALIADYARQATDTVKRITGRVFERQTGIVEKVAGNGRYWLLLSNYPVTTITSISFDGETVDSALYELYDAKSGIVYANSKWKNSFAYEGKRYTVTYSAGYILPGRSGRDLPYEIEAATFELAKAMFYSRTRDPAVGSEEVPQVYKTQIGGRSSGSDLPPETLVTPDILRLLRPFMAQKL